MGVQVHGFNATMDMADCAASYAWATGDESQIAIQYNATNNASAMSSGLLYGMASDAVHGAAALTAMASESIGAQFETITGYRGFGYTDRTNARVQSLGDRLGTFAAKVDESPLDATVGAASRALGESLARSNELYDQGKYFESGGALSGPVEAFTGLAAGARALAKIVSGAFRSPSVAAISTEGADGSPAVRLNDIDSEFGAVNQQPLLVESGQPGLLRNTQNGQFASDPFAVRAEPVKPPSGNRNARSTQEPTIFYRIDVDGQGRKLGISSVPPTAAGEYTRPAGQVRKLRKLYGPDTSVRYRIRNAFENRSDGLDYENLFLERFKRLYGEYPGETLPGGNRTNR